MDQVSTVGRPRRREYSPEFKSSVLEQCRQPGASVAGVALGHGIDPNMVHRWFREERQRRMLATLRNGAPAFVPLQLQPAPVAVEDLGAQRGEPPAGGQSAVAEDIRIEIQRPAGSVTVHWPLTAAAQCAQLLKDWLR